MLKGDGTGVRIVSDFKRFNQAIERPNWSTESSTQLLRLTDPEVRFFVSLDLTSGCHQIRIDEESQNLLGITTPMGRHKYTVLAQGITSAPDIFNYLTDGSMRYDGLGCIENMDDVILYGKTIKELKEKLEKFLAFCLKKNSVLPKDRRIQAFYNMRKHSCKQDVQIFCRMLASLQQLNPLIPMNIPAMRKATGIREKFEWKWKKNIKWC